MAKKTNVKVSGGSYPFHEQGGSNSKSRAPHSHAGVKDPRKGPSPNIHQPQRAQTASPSSNQSAQMGNSAPANPVNAIRPKNVRSTGFGALKRPTF